MAHCSSIYDAAEHACLTCIREYSQNKPTSANDVCTDADSRYHCKSPLELAVESGSVEAVALFEELTPKCVTYADPWTLGISLRKASVEMIVYLHETFLCREYFISAAIDEVSQHYALRVMIHQRPEIFMSPTLYYGGSLFHVAVEYYESTLLDVMHACGSALIDARRKDVRFDSPPLGIKQYNTVILKTLVRLGSRALITQPFNGEHLPRHEFIYAATLAALSSGTHKGINDKLRQEVREQTHFRESSGDRLYTLVKLAGYWQRHGIFPSQQQQRK